MQQYCNNDRASSSHSPFFETKRREQEEEKEEAVEENEKRREKQEGKKDVTVDQARMARATRGTNGERNDAERHLYWDLLICSQPRH